MTYSTYRIHIHGIVQGVGFRPAVDRIATECGITGFVSNKGSYVEVICEADETSVREFIEAIKTNAPERSVIVKITSEKIGEHAEKQYASFSIAESEKIQGEIYISPDIAICDDCKRELFDREDKRYLHPFINCTQCGPRFTIIESLPYDRERTTMKKFPMCPDCEKEYYDSGSRRYDAQPVCCPECGPEVYVLWKSQKDSAEGVDKNSNVKSYDVKSGIENNIKNRISGSDAITETRRVIASGGIAAIKGIGGFHLCCDATNDDACSRLRDLKKRQRKPFAVMARDITVAMRECIVNEADKKILTGHIKPILLLEKKQIERDTEIEVTDPAVKAEKTDSKIKNLDNEEQKLSRYIAPDNPTVGVMLPYAPIQMLLFSYNDDIEMPDCMVMTSGNDSGAPIVKDDETAIEELRSLSDIILSNDRDILTRADDSVLELVEDKPYMIRRSRGYAPLPVMLSEESDINVLAIGSELKDTVTVSRGNLYYPSAHIGDLGDMRSIDALQDSVSRMLTLFETHPDIIVCDKHPRYSSVEFAEKLAEEMEIPLLKLQHHYCHVVSCMAENGDPGPVIGVSFDGTGYGDDGTIWGGEIIYATYSSYDRIGSIAPFAQVGGDSSAREGWRIAASVFMDMEEEISAVGSTVRIPAILVDPDVSTEEDVFADNSEQCIPDGKVFATKLGLCSEKEYEVMEASKNAGLNTVISTSAGRIFDAVSAILGIRRESEFEGDAATSLMYAAERFENKLDQEDLDAENSNNKDNESGASTGQLHANYEALLSEWRRFYVTMVSLRNDTIEKGISVKGIDIIKRLMKENADYVDDPMKREIIHTDILMEFIAIEAIKCGQSPAGKEMLSYFFHDILSDMVRHSVESAPRKFVEKLAEEFRDYLNKEAILMFQEILSIKTVALTGGVFQNKLLMRLTRDRMRKSGYKVIVHSLIPPNDGGISLGQAVAASHIYAENHRK